MGQVVSFVDYTPPARFDSPPVAWTHVQIEEAPAATGPWTLIDTLALSPLDSNPASPTARSFTTDEGTGPDLWYRVLFTDASSDTSNPTEPVQNSEPTVAAGTLYQTRNDIKATGGITSAFTNDDIDRALAAACRGIDLACGRPHGFYPDPDATTVRYYTPQAADIVVIDDLITLTAFETSQFGGGVFDHAWTLNSDFVLEPLNAALNAKPYTRIKLNPWKGLVGFPYWAPRSARLTGKFGWATTPPQIVEAAGLLTNRLLQRARSAPLGVIFQAELAARIAFTDPDVKSLITDFIREEV